MSKFEKLSNSQVKLTIEVSKEQFLEAIDKTYPESIKNVKLDGFRPGKIPFKVFISHYGYEPLYEEAVNEAINNTYRDAIAEHKVAVVDYPQIDLVGKVSHETGFTYEATVYVVPEIELKQYTGLYFEGISKTVSKKEVEAEVTKALNNKAENVLKEDKAVLGDTVVIDFEGFIDGVAFEGGKGENFDLVLGSGQFIPGFEDQLVGCVAGDSKDVNVVFPENYHADLASKAATFKVVVHEVKTKVCPELTDEFVKELSIEGVGSVDEYREYLKNNLKASKAKAYDEDFMNKLFDILVKTNPVELPEVMVTNYAKDLEEQYRKQAEQYKIPFETLLQFQGMDEKTFKERINAQATNQISLDIVIDAVVEKENFKCKDKDVEAEFEKIAEANKTTVDKVKQIVSVESVSEHLKRNMAVEFLKKNNGPKFKETTK